MGGKFAPVTMDLREALALAAGPAGTAAGIKADKPGSAPFVAYLSYLLQSSGPSGFLDQPASQSALCYLSGGLLHQKKKRLENLARIFFEQEGTL